MLLRGPKPQRVGSRFARRQPHLRGWHAARGTRGALRYPCQATHGALANSNTFCHRLTAETHAYDVATKPWLLPLMAQRSEAVRELLPLMAASLPHERLTFSQAIAWLQHRLRTGGHNGSLAKLHT